MSHDNTIRMARELPEPVGRTPPTKHFYETKFYTEDQMRQAIKDAITAEREECAKVCDDLNNFSGHSSKRPWPSDCAAGIRARGDK